MYKSPHVFAPANMCVPHIEKQKAFTLYKYNIAAIWFAICQLPLC